MVGIGQRARRGGVVEHAVHARRDGGNRTAADADLVALEHDGAERHGVEQARAEVGIAAGIAQRLRAEAGQGSVRHGPVAERAAVRKNSDRSKFAVRRTSPR